MTEVFLNEEVCDVAIVGGGTSGLALASELMRISVGRVIVLERESEAGGVPRHCGHYPFGLGEHRKLMKGPDYARHNREIATGLGVEIRTDTTVTALRPEGVLEIADNERRYLLSAKRVVLCTGVRESSRAQRFIGGDRPKGVISTGALQSMVYQKGMMPFRRPVILGSELVSFSAIQTCKHGGIRPVAMVEEEERIIARRFFQPYLALKGVPLHTGARNLRIVGSDQVEALEFTDTHGKEFRIEADGVIMSGRFRPESALVHISHLAVDPATGGPVIDQFGRCSDPAYYCSGNIIRPAETSGFCWREGVETARRIASGLGQKPVRVAKTLPVLFDDPAIRFAVPQCYSLSGEPGGMKKLYLGLKEDVNAAITVHAGEHKWHGRLKAKPVRRIQIPLPEVDLKNPPDEIRITLERS